MKNVMKSAGRKSISSFRPLLAVGTILIGLVTVLVVYDLISDKSQIQLESERELRTVAEASAAQLSTYLDSVNDVLTAAVNIVEDSAEQEKPLSSSTKDALRGILVGTPVSSLSLIDGSGELVTHTGSELLPSTFQPYNVAIKALAAHPERPFIAIGPIQSPNDDSIQIYAASPVRTRSGQLIGALVAPINLQKFASVAQEASKEEGVTAEIFSRYEGALLARFPNVAPISYFRKYVDEPLFQNRISAAAKPQLLKNPVDGQSQYIATKELSHFPLWIAVGVAKHVLTDKWRSSAIRTLILGNFSALCIILLLVTIDRHLKRLSARSKITLESERRFNKVLDQLRDPLYVRTVDGELVIVNERFTTFFGLNSKAAAIGRLFHDVNRSVNADMVANSNREALKVNSRPYVLEAEIMKPDGNLVPVEYKLNNIILDKKYCILGQIVDVSARKQYERQLTLQATIDDVTSLPNRGLFMDRLANALGRNQRSGKLCAVLILEVNHFGRVTDVYGMQNGDALLSAIGQRLSLVVRESDTVARIAGAKFGVVVSEITNPVECRLLCDRIIKAIGEPFNLSGRAVSSTLAIGIAVFPDDTVDPDTLIGNAEAALFETKRIPGSSFRFFDAEMDSRVRELVRIGELLPMAIEAGEMSLAYQPIRDPRTGTIVKAEALARWQSHQLGQVPPNNFIEVAEQSGFITRLGDWIIHEACKAAATWAEQTSEPIAVSVNISARQFKDQGFIESVHSALEVSKLAPELLELEITEQLLIGDDDSALETIRDLQEMRVSLSLDDFGTGCSSLSYLTKFPLNTVKIDHTFIHDLHHSHQRQHVAKAIIAMAQDLGLRVVAEGVETIEQADLLTSYGCDYIQGYLYGQPVDMSDMLRLLAHATR